jgi:NDP-sugar pyrophosphorylase family protein
VIAESLTIGEGSVIFGNLFSHSDLFIGPNCQVGRPGKRKSVIAQERLVLSESCRIFNYVLSYEKGEVR